MTQIYILPVVGAHFRPPAKAILGVLPSGAKLWLEPEPDNPYDQNALRVIVRSADIPPTTAKSLDLAAGPFGFTAEEIFQKPDWHLGYLPREKAEVLAGPVAEAFEVNGEVGGNLTFDPTGKPQIRFSIPDSYEGDDQ